MSINNNEHRVARASAFGVRFALAAMGVCLAAACSHLPELPTASGPAATPGLAPRERVRLAVELLGEGDVGRAELELNAALAEQPGNRAAQRLHEQITEDPRTLLGENARPYTVRQGETMSMLAERFLGDPLLFYALARYNDIEAPNRVSEGQRLMIPRRAGVTVAAASSSSDLTPPPLPATTPAQPPRGLDPARANQLRLQGLQQLNTGNVQGAIALLRQAQALDDANPAIQRDLDRALRLQAALSEGPG